MSDPKAKAVMNSAVASASITPVTAPMMIRYMVGKCGEWVGLLAVETVMLRMS